MESDKNIVSINLEKIALPLSLIASALIITLGLSTSLLLGLNNLSNKLSKDFVQSNDQVQEQPTNQGISEETLAKAAVIGDNPYIGNPETAKVAILEFSDYNCTFCRRFHTEGTFSEIAKNYIDTGKVVYVYKTFAGTGGADTAAAGNAAYCAYKQVGSEYYFDLLKKAYSATQLVDLAYMRSLIEEAGKVDMNKLNECIENNTYAQKIAEDKQSGLNLQMQGTPGFYIGNFDSNGNVRGDIINGAQPYATFEAMINQYL